MKKIDPARAGDLAALENLRGLVRTKISWAKTYRARAARATSSGIRDFARMIAAEELAAALYWNGRVMELRRLIGA